MGVYDRDSDLPKTVSDLSKNIETIKQAQIIGNDNLIVKVDPASLNSESISSGVAGIFKMTYTFDNPSNSYVIPRVLFSVSTSYNSYFYADPATVNDNTKKSWFLSITPTGNATTGILFIAKCSDTGSATIVRTA